MVDRALAHHSGKGTGYRKETNTSALSLFHTKNRFDLLKLSSNDEYNECNEYFEYDDDNNYYVKNCDEYFDKHYDNLCKATDDLNLNDGKSIQPNIYYENV